MNKKSLGTGNTWSLVFTMALALFNLGIFGLVLLSGNQLNKFVKENFEIQIFLNKDLTLTQIEQFQKVLSNKAFVAVKSGKPAVAFTSKEEAGKKFIEETGENYAQFLGENPLRDAFTIKIADKDLSAEKLKQIKHELTSQHPEVFEVVYIENLIGSIQENIRRISIISLGISALLLVTAMWLIRNTVKLAVFSQRFLIRTMELVGAEPWFIQKPYISSMFWRGLGGGLLSGFFILISLQVANNYVPQVRLLLIPEQIGILILTLPLIGCIVGSVSSWLSVRKFQGRKLDDLHTY
ncbi:MAG TPA: permease-like cell division protein FtsX [Catalimonadaceae bacterium]|nr:permease-like cell division protein FtsX [Catalimonadaceae bacterium]HPI10146.1 permease-like cell division protein FtsX [Catalimonadaceae bacterium]